MSTAPSTNRPAMNSSGSSSTAPKNKSPAQPTTPSPGAPSGVSRTRSARTGTPSSATTVRAAARKPASKEAKNGEDEDSKAETAQLIEDLREQIRKTEAASDEYERQLTVVQSRLDEALEGQSKLEETSEGHVETVSSLHVQMEEMHRSKGDLQMRLEDEQIGNNKEREAASSREAELNEVIARLKESFVSRESRMGAGAEGGLARTASLRGRASASTERPPMDRRDSSQNTAQLLLQKDKIIESLRLEIAEASLKVMEVDRAGGGRLQALEKQLLDVRMSNAKLMEDNESYQYLLQEKTLTREFIDKFSSPVPSNGAYLSTSRAPSRGTTGGNLADELETVGEEGESPVAGRNGGKDLEKELAMQKDQNRAMALYINKIISRLLATESFEHLFEEGSVTGDNPLTAAKAKAQAEKELPAPPMGEDEGGKENAAGSLLQRAGSLFGGKRVRPRSYQPPQAQTGSEGIPRASMEQAPTDLSTLTSKPMLTLTDDPTTSTRVPLTLQRGSSVRLTSNPRSHRRTTSDIATSTSGSPYTTSRTVSGGTLGPPVTFTKSPPMSANLAPTTTINPISPASPEVTATDLGDFSGAAETAPPESASSPPRSVGASSSEGGRTSGGTATMAGGRQMRPLRLVQEKAEQDAEKRRANRGSWMGWFNKGPQPQGALGTPALMAPFPSGLQNQTPGGPQGSGAQS